MPWAQDIWQLYTNDHKQKAKGKQTRIQTNPQISIDPKASVCETEIGVRFLSPICLSLIVKENVHPEKKILSLFTHPHAVMI